MLVTATADVDKSDKSYYGVSHLYVLSAQGDSFQVPLDKEGPLHAVQWNPTGREFCVCYGFMPSKVRTTGEKALHEAVPVLSREGHSSILKLAGCPTWKISFLEFT